MFDNPLATAYVLAVAGVLGLVAGSFITCWAWRATHGESVREGRSHCTSCAHELAPRDLVPIVSWLASRGRCRYCGEKVSARYPIAEAVCACAFMAVVAVYGLSLETAELLLLCCTLLFSSLTDIEERIIPDGCIAFAVVVRLAYLMAMVAMGELAWGDVGFYVASGLGVGAVMLVVVLAADRLFHRESMGGGDLKLFAVAGLYFGWHQSLLLIIVSCVVGIVVALASARANGDQSALGRAFPFGPSIAFACLVTMLVGGAVVEWYVALL